MGDLKPLGSEKLKADEKLKRILELAYYKENKNKSNANNSPELVKEGINGLYGIVKEKDGYYVKKGLNESALEYIGGIFMKNKNRFSSYAEALKRLELLKGQEELQEATKYVLKTAAPKSEEPAPSPAMSEAPPAPAAPEASAEAPVEPRPEGDAPEEPMDMGGEESPEEAPAGDDIEGGEDSSPEHMKEVQRLSGKLGQAIREVNDKMESDDVKYVINMLLSAVDIEKLSEEDKEEIVDRFEPKEEGFGGEEDGSEEEETSYDETPDLDGGEIDQKPEEEVSEIDDPIASLEELINTDLMASDEDGVSLNSEDDEESDELDIAPELSSEINESIKTTLSKYFE